MITSSSKIICQEIKQDTTVLITHQQLKTTNLIFAEHQQLLIENSLLYKQLDLYKQDNKLLIELDSINNHKLVFLDTSYKQNIELLNAQIQQKNRRILTYKICGISVSIGLVALLLFMK
jgi:hypothetical protein